MGVSVFAGVGQQALSASGLMPAFIRAPRSIGAGTSAIIPDVTIEEHFSDRAQVTQHPVATNTTVSDHMFMLPKTVTMRCGFSNSNIVGGLVQAGIGAISGGASLLDTGSNVLGLFTEQRCNQIYKKLRDLQTSRQAFVLTTGKRSYPDQTTSPLSSLSLGSAVSNLFTTGSLTGSKPSAGNMVITELAVTNDRHTEYALIIEVHMQEVIMIDLADTGPETPQNSAIPQTTAAPQDGGTQQPAPQDNSSAQTLLGGPGYHKASP